MSCQVLGPDHYRYVAAGLEKQAQADTHFLVDLGLVTDTAQPANKTDLINQLVYDWYTLNELEYHLTYHGEQPFDTSTLVPPVFFERSGQTPFPGSDLELYAAINPIHYNVSLLEGEITPPLSETLRQRHTCLSDLRDRLAHAVIQATKLLNRFPYEITHFPG